MIRVINLTASAIPAAILRHAAQLPLRSGRRERRSLTIVLLPSKEMARLNWQFLRHRGPTDVLAFPEGERGLLGEIAVSPAVARRQARALGIPWKEELARHVVHGCLHLMGYDDHSPQEKKRMWRRQERILASRSMRDKAPGAA